MGAGYTMKARAEEAEVYIYEDVGEGWFGGVSAKQFADDLKALGGVTTIHVHLNSPGGDVFAGMAIYRQLVDHAAKVVVHIDGLAGSIASVIAMAGDEILITEAGFVMIHEAESGVLGRAEDMRKRADLLDTVTASIVDVYVARTGGDPAEIRAWMAAETWMTAVEAVERGFAEQVVENLRVAAHYDMAKHTFRKLPDVIAALRTPLSPLTALAFGTEEPQADPADPPAKPRHPLAAKIALQAARLAASRSTQSAA